MHDINDIDRTARIFALFGDPTRLKIVRLLARTKRAKVTDIATGVEMSVACISHHLQLLKDNGVLESTREGNSIFYNFTSDPFIKSIKSLIK